VPRTPPELTHGGRGGNTILKTMTIFDVTVPGGTDPSTRLGPRPGVATLVVNVASKCGLTPQYNGLERLQERYAGRGFTVLGVPCNQFGGQEPGTAEEIAEFCSATYGVTFPLTEKIEVNGDHRHPLYAELVSVPDAEGYTGDIRWNFEKFLVGRDGNVCTRYFGLRPKDRFEADIKALL